MEPEQQELTLTQTAGRIDHEAEPYIPTLDDRFLDWIHSPDGGEVSNKFIRLAIAMKRSGFKQYGAKGIVERLRWHFEMKQRKTGGEEYKINNNYTSRLARFAEERCRELECFFNKRQLKSE